MTGLSGLVIEVALVSATPCDARVGCRRRRPRSLELMREHLPDGVRPWMVGTQRDGERDGGRRRRRRARRAEGSRRWPTDEVSIGRSARGRQPGRRRIASANRRRRIHGDSSCESRVRGWPLRRPTSTSTRGEHLRGFVGGQLRQTFRSGRLRLASGRRSTTCELRAPQVLHRFGGVHRPRHGEGSEWWDSNGASASAWYRAHGIRARSSERGSRTAQPTPWGFRPRVGVRPLRELAPLAGDSFVGRSSRCAARCGLIQRARSAVKRISSPERVAGPRLGGVQRVGSQFGGDVDVRVQLDPARRRHRARCRLRSGLRARPGVRPPQRRVSPASITGGW